MTLEHRHPFALGGPATVENLCLLCRAHNAQAARRVFGDTFIATRVAAREVRKASLDDDVARNQNSDTVRSSPAASDAFAKVRSALTHLGFPERAITSTLLRLYRDHPGLEAEPLLRAALNLLTPPPAPAPS